MLKYQGTCFCNCYADALLFFAFCDTLQLGSIHNCTFGWQVVLEKERPSTDFNFSFCSFFSLPEKKCLFHFFLFQNLETEKASLNYFELQKNWAILFPQGVLYTLTRPLNLGLHSKICAVETSIALKRITYMTKYSQLNLSYCWSTL